MFAPFLGLAAFTELYNFGGIEWREFYDFKGKDLFKGWTTKYPNTRLCQKKNQRLAVTCENHLNEVSLE